MLQHYLRWCNRTISHWRRRFAGSAPTRRRPGLRIELLEDRLVPAFNLAIDTSATVDVGHIDTPGTDRIRTFTALAADANLNVGDIQAALQAGFDVVVSSGSGGGSTGDISWRSGADLDFQGTGSHSLTLETDAQDTGREVNLASGLFDGNFVPGDRLALRVLTGGSDGVVTLSGLQTEGGGLQVTAGARGIQLSRTQATAGGNVALTGNVWLVGTTTIDTTGSVTDGSLTISGGVDGLNQAENLDLVSGTGTISLGGDLGGDRQLLGNLNVSGVLAFTADRTITVQGTFTEAGAMDLGGHTVTVATGPLQLNGTLSGTGTLHADMPVLVNSGGTVQAGAAGSAGTLEIDGAVVFGAGSQLLVDLATPDKLHVTGTAELDAGALLVGTRTILSGAGPFQVLQADGGLTGQGTFDNTAGTVLLGLDAVTVAYGAGTVQISQVAAGNNQVTGAAPDGTLYTVKLTGGGTAQLVVVSPAAATQAQVAYSQWVAQTVRQVRYRTENRPVSEQVTDTTYQCVNGKYVATTTTATMTRLVSVTVPYAYTVVNYQQVAASASAPAFDVVVRNATQANKLTITTTANGSTGNLAVGTILVSGSLAALTAPTTTVTDLESNGYVKTVALAGLQGEMNTGGGKTQPTSITIGQIDASITTTSPIAALACNEAVAVMPNGSGARVIITAPSIGRLTTTANSALHLAGDFNADLQLDAGTTTASALGSATIAGGISGGTWNIHGTVGTVTVKQAIEGWQLGTQGPPLPGPLGNLQTLVPGNLRALVLGDVQNASIQTAGTLGQLTVADWMQGQITASAIGKLHSAGVFDADLTLDTGADTTLALGSAAIGSILTGFWSVRGALGPLTVQQNALNWTLGGTGTGAAPTTLGAIQALQLGSGDSNLVLTAGGRIGTLAVAGALSGTIQASGIGTLTVGGTLDATLTLNAGTDTAVAVQTATLGQVDGSVWDIHGAVGTVTVNGLALNWILGTHDPSFQYPDLLTSLGTLTVKDVLQGSTLNVSGAIKSLKAAQWQTTNLTAKALGTLTVTGSAAAGEAGDVLFSTLTLTGASAQVGLGMAKITGSVADSTFNVLGGNVTSFTCGRFLSSNLYVGFAAGNFVTAARLGTFTTTMLPAVPHQSDPRTDAFQNSMVVATSFGTVTLSGVNVDNGGTPFGLRVNGSANAGTVLIGTAPFKPGTHVPVGTIEGDFEFLAS